MDHEALARLHIACFTMPRPWSATEITGLLPDDAVFLCSVRGGFAMGRTVLDEAELLTLAVAPEQRRQGLGRRLLADFEAEAGRRGAAKAFLEVAADNPAAIALYEAAGYAQVGLRRDYFHGAEGARTDAVVINRALDTAI